MSDLKLTKMQDEAIAISLPSSAIISVTSPAHYKSVFTSNPTTWALLIWQAAMIILFATCSKFPLSYSPGGVHLEKPARYSMWMDTHTS